MITVTATRDSIACLSPNIQILSGAGASLQTCPGGTETNFTSCSYEVKVDGIQADVIYIYKAHIELYGVESSRDFTVTTSFSHAPVFRGEVFVLIMLCFCSVRRDLWS